MNPIKQAIREAIEIDKQSKYAVALTVIEKSKEEFGNCECPEPENGSGLMSTKMYVGIHFIRCKKCLAYSFRQDQIFDFINKIKNNEHT